MSNDDRSGTLPSPPGDTLSADAAEKLWDSEALQRFVKGEITLAELQGVDAESQEKVAQLGYRLLGAGKLEDARLLFEGLVALNGKEPYFLLAAGAVAQRQERYDDADHWYSRALERNGSLAVAFANRGEVRVMRGDLEGAVPDLIEAVKLDPAAKEPNTARARGLLAELNRQLNPGAAAPAGESGPARSRLKPLK